MRRRACASRRARGEAAADGGADSVARMSRGARATRSARRRRASSALPPAWTPRLRVPSPAGLSRLGRRRRRRLGPGHTVGAALALRDSGRSAGGRCARRRRFPDGRHRLVDRGAYRHSAARRRRQQPLVLQRRTAPAARGGGARPAGRATWIGQRIDEPEIDLAQLARAQGAVGIGPITEDADLAATFRAAIAAVEGGAVAVVDVRVASGYAPATMSGLFRG